MKIQEVSLREWIDDDRAYLDILDGKVRYIKFIEESEPLIPIKELVGAFLFILGFLTLITIIGGLKSDVGVIEFALHLWRFE